MIFSAWGGKYNQGLRIAKVAKMYKMVRLFRLARLLKMYNKHMNKNVTHQAKIQTAVIRASFFLCGLLIVIHLSSSFWIGVGLLDGRTWLN